LAWSFPGAPPSIPGCHLSFVSRRPAGRHGQSQRERFEGLLADASSKIAAECQPRDEVRERSRRNSCYLQPSLWWDRETAVPSEPTCLWQHRVWRSEVKAGRRPPPEAARAERVALRERAGRYSVGRLGPKAPLGIEKSAFWLALSPAKPGQLPVRSIGIVTIKGLRDKLPANRWETNQRKRDKLPVEGATNYPWISGSCPRFFP
jgi:hypothetical protein